MRTNPPTTLRGALVALAVSCTLLLAPHGARAAPPPHDPCGEAVKACQLGTLGDAPTPVAPDQRTQATEANSLALAWSPLAGVYADATPRMLPNGNFVVQIADDGAPYYHFRVGGMWSGPNATGGQFLSTVTPAGPLAQPQQQPATIELFGVGLDEAMWYSTSPGAWQSLGGGFLSDPEAVIFNGVTYVFGVGFDNAVWYRSLGSGWISLGGYVTTDVAVTTDGTSMYVTARGGDQALWSRRLLGSSWEPWVYLGGVVETYPSAVSVGGAGYVFVVGADNAVWYQRVQNGSWSGWQGLGGISLSAPAAAQGQNLELDVYVVGTDLAMYSRSLTAAGWSGWQSLGGGFRTSPAAGGSQVAGIGLDGWLYVATAT